MCTDLGLNPQCPKPLNSMQLLQQPKPLLQDWQVENQGCKEQVREARNRAEIEVTGDNNVQSCLVVDGNRIKCFLKDFLLLF